VANIKLIETSIFLVIVNKHLTPSDLKHGVNAFTMCVRETKKNAEMMDMNFDTV
jgi:hypothetical protein